MSFLSKVAGAIISPAQRKQMIRETLQEWSAKFAIELNCQPHEVRLMIAVNVENEPYGVLYKGGQKIRTVNINEFVPEEKS